MAKNNEEITHSHVTLFMKCLPSMITFNYYTDKKWMDKVCGSKNTILDNSLFSIG